VLVVSIFCEIKTIILLDANFGVMVAVNPESAKVPLDTETDVLVLFPITCKTPPVGLSEFPQAAPSYIDRVFESFRYATIPSTGVGIADPLAAVPAKLITD
jgi:hypothetical protein